MELIVTYDGHALNDYAVVEEVDRPLAGSYDLNYATVTGMDGRMYLSGRRDSYSIALTLAFIGHDYAEVLAKIRTVAGWLSTDEPKKLVIGDEDGLWRMVVPSGEMRIERVGHTAARVELAFEAPDAMLHGGGGVMQSSDGTAVVRIDGTLPAPVVIASSAASGDFEVMEMDLGAFVRVEVGSTAKSVEIDCGQRTCAVGGSTAMVTLASDWLVLDPGWHTLTRVDGSGEFTVSYESRWA